MRNSFRSIEPVATESAPTSEERTSGGDIVAFANDAITGENGVTPGENGVNLEEIGNLVENGATGFDSCPPQDLKMEKIQEKLKQVEGYITQTTTAMQALEQEGDLVRVHHPVHRGVLLDARLCYNPTHFGLIYSMSVLYSLS